MKYENTVQHNLYLVLVAVSKLKSILAYDINHVESNAIPCTSIFRTPFNLFPDKQRSILAFRRSPSHQHYRLSMASSEVVDSAKGASLLILLQVGSRGFTFLVNQILLRYLSPELVGLNAQLELFSITVLYFARESIRVAAQRQPGQTQKIVNLAYLAIALGFPLAYGLGYLYLRAETPGIPFFGEALWIYGESCVIELLAEPAFVAAQQKLLYRVRGFTETFAIITRCIVTCTVAVWASKNRVDVGVLPFAMGQLGYASMLLGLYWLQLWPVAAEMKFSLLPQSLKDDK